MPSLCGVGLILICKHCYWLLGTINNYFSWACAQLNVVTSKRAIVYTIFFFKVYIVTGTRMVIAMELIQLIL